MDRENDNIALQTELERVRTHAIGFDTMKTSLEHNRAHLQRELYAREGEINRLQCSLRVRIDLLAFTNEDYETSSLES